MHHQVQQFGDLGLERLGFGGGGIGGGGHYRARLMAGQKIAEKSDIAKLFRVGKLAGPRARKAERPPRMDERIAR